MIKFLIPPSFLESEKTRNSLYFNKLIIGTAIIISTLGILLWIVLPNNYPRWIFIIVSTNIVGLGLFFLNKAGKTRTASLFLIIYLITLIFGLSWSAGGIKALAMQEILIVVLVTGLILGWKEGVFIAICAIIASLGLVFLEYSGVLPASNVNANPLSLWINLSFLMIILAILQYFIVANIAKAHQEIKHELTMRKESESRLNTISKNFTSGMIYQVVVTPDGKRVFTYLSDSVKILYGVSPEEAMADSNKIYSRIHEEDISELIILENKAIKANITFKAEARVRNPNGEIRWSSFVSTPSMMDDGSLRYDGIEFIITEQKIVEEELQKSEAGFRTIFEKSATGYVLTSPSGQLLQLNVAMADMLGYSIEELKQLNFKEITHPDDISISNQSMQSLLNGEADTIKFEKRYIHRNGTVVWTIINTTLIRDNQNKPQYFLTNTLDITESKKAQEALSASEAQLRELWSNTVEGIVIHDHGIIVELNKPMCELFGVSREQVIGKSLLDFATPGMRDKIQQHINSPSESHIETSAVRPDGKNLMLEVFAKEVLYQNKPLRMASIRDITERKKAEKALHESEEMFRIAFDATPSGMSLIGPDGFTYLAVNPYLCEMFGYTREEFIGETVHLVTHADDEEKSNEWIRKKFNGEPCEQEIEKRYIHKNGHIVWGVVRAEWILNTDGSKRMAIAHIQDITKRKLAEEALRKSEERLRMILENMPILLNAFDEQGNIIFWNKACEKVTGYGAEEIIGNQGAMEMFYPDSDYRAMVWNSSVNNTGKINEYDLVTKNGEIRTIEWFDVYHSIHIPGWASWGLGQDITMRKKIEEELIQSELRHRMASELASDYVYKFTIAADGKIELEYVSESFYIITGRNKDTIASIDSWTNIIHPEDIGKVMLSLQDMIKGQRFVEIECRSYVHGNKLRWINIVSKSEWDEKEKRITAIIGAVKDITERKKAEEALKKSEEKFSKAFKVSPASITIASMQDGRYIEVNEVFLKTTGFQREEAIGHTSGELGVWVNSEDRKKFIYKLTKNGSLNNFETSFRMKSGEIRNFMVSSELIDLEGEKCSLNYIIDITEKKNIEHELDKYHNQLERLVKERTDELELTNEELKAINDELYKQKDELQIALSALNDAQNQLIQSEKMASLGILSAGIAHEINNPLNFIQGGSLGIENYFNRNLEEHKQKINKFLNAINVGVKRAADIVSSLSHYSRHDDLPKTDCNIHTIIDNSLIMLENQLKNRIVVSKQYTDQAHIIFGNDGKLHQAMLNIIANAEQSIEKEGTISILTEVINNELTIYITDSGCGISEENMQKIFDPFYTTKPPQQGTGLGLSITYNIIQEHLGTIKYESQTNKGTKVTIKLPTKTD